MRLNTIQMLVLGVSLILAVLVTGLVAFSVLTWKDGPSQNVEIDPMPFQVGEKETYKMIGMRLEKEGFIADDRDFNTYIRDNHLQNRLRAGDYLLAPTMTIPEITEKLISPRGALRTFHVYDGVNLEQIANVFATRNIMDKTTFWDLVANGDFSAYGFVEAPNGQKTRLEGFLYPGHYEYRESDTPHDILSMMLSRFERNMNSIEIQNKDLSFVEIVNLASLIEKEAANDKEKPIIASVYMNRLAIGQPLQCDATVVYAMEEKKSVLSFSDYRYESPYNTYLIKGLPPTPIANPGLASLRAAAKPAETDYFFYLLDTKHKDAHVFAKDYDEHLENRVKYGYD